MLGVSLAPTQKKVSVVCVYVCMCVCVHVSSLQTLLSYFQGVYYMYVAIFTGHVPGSYYRYINLDTLFSSLVPSLHSQLFLSCTGSKKSRLRLFTTYEKKLGVETGNEAIIIINGSLVPCSLHSVAFSSLMLEKKKDCK